MPGSSGDVLDHDDGDARDVSVALDERGPDDEIPCDAAATCGVPSCGDAFSAWFLSFVDKRPVLRRGAFVVDEDAVWPASLRVRACEDELSKPRLRACADDERLLAPHVAYASDVVSSIALLPSPQRPAAPRAAYAKTSAYADGVDH